MGNRKTADGAVVQWAAGTPKGLEYPLSFYLQREAAVMLEVEEGILKMKQEEAGA